MVDLGALILSWPFNIPFATVYKIKDPPHCISINAQVALYHGHVTHALPLIIDCTGRIFGSTVAKHDGNGEVTQNGSHSLKTFQCDTDHLVKKTELKVILSSETSMDLFRRLSCILFLSTIYIQGKF